MVGVVGQLSGGGGGRSGRGGGPTASILIKTGTGKNALKGLEALHEKLAEMEIDLTWEAAFLKYFNVRIDSTRYRVRRGERPAQKHFLGETIRVWLGEFKKVRATYVAHVLEDKGHDRTSGAGAGVKAATAPGRLPQGQSGSRSDPPSANRATATASGSSANNGRKSRPPKKNTDKTDKRKRGKVKFPSPKRVKREPSPVPSVASNATAPVPPPSSPQRARPGAAAAAGFGPSPGGGGAGSSNNRNRAHQPQQVQNGSGGADLPPGSQSTSGSQQQRRRPAPPRFPEDLMNGQGQGQVGRGGNGAEMMEDYDDYDVASQCSQDSQDSQDELVELGIPNEDFKSVFIKKAMDKFSNSELLKARQALRELKNRSQNRESNNRWTKFVMMCPLPVTVLRELFDV